MKLKGKILFIMVFIIFSVSQLYSQTDWTLVWEDKFDGDSLDMTKWEHEVIGDGCGNEELQYYTDRPQNCYIEKNAANDDGQFDDGDDSVLVIKAIKENYTGPDGTRGYTSARIRTINKGDWTYGKIEARLKLPQGTQGIWPAFWMLPTENKYGIWPKSGEIDIMEYIGRDPTTIHGTLHYGAKWPKNFWKTASRDVSTDNVNDTFHLYTIEWEYDEIRWYFDGELYNTIRSEDIDPFFWPHQEDYHILLNLAVGGRWPGNPDETTIMPQEYKIDYVRVYKRNNSHNVDGPTFITAPKNGLVYTTNITADSYNWIVPEGIQIVSGQGTHTITVNVEAQTIGSIQCNAVVNGNIVNLGHHISVKEYTSSCFEDFETNRNVNYIETSGDFNDNTLNPAPDSINSSQTVCYYTRNIDYPYDIIRMGLTNNILNASELDNERSYITLDFYSEEVPIGTQLYLVLENSERISENYPAGRQSTWETSTTKQGEWETLVFEYQKHDDRYNTSVLQVDSMSLILDPGNMTDYSMYYDNLTYYSTKCEYIDKFIMRDFENINDLTLAEECGGIADENALNPSPNSVNNSETVSSFITDGTETYSYLRYNLAELTKSQVYMSGKYKFALDIYTDQPAGTKISINLEHSDQNETEIDGINSDYVTKTTKQNEWETLYFDYNNWYDWPIKNDELDQLVVLFSPGIEVSGNFYIDNIRILKEDPTYQGSTEPYLNTIEISPTSADLEIGDICQFTASGKDQFGNDFPAEITWSVSGNIGTIDQNGLFTAATKGEGTVQAESGSINSNVKVNVDNSSQPYLSTIEISPSSADLEIGDTCQFTASGKDQFGNDFPAEITWSVSGNIGTIDQNGLFTAATKGEGRVQAESGNINSNVKVNVEQSVGFTWTGDMPNGMLEGQQANYTSTARYKNNILTITFESNNINDLTWIWAYIPAWNNMINVNGNKYSIDLENMTEGETIEWYFVINKNGSEANNVTAKHSWVIKNSGSDDPYLNEIIISPDTADLTIGDTCQFTAAGKDQFGNDFPAEITWSVSGSIGTISQDGLFSASAIGEGVIQAVSGSITANIAVKVRDDSTDFIWTGNLPNGLLEGTQVNYTVTASYSNNTVTITFTSNNIHDLTWVWLYSPGWYNMTKISNNTFSITLDNKNPGDFIEWYFLVNKNGQEANNVTAKHSWTVVE